MPPFATVDDLATYLDATIDPGDPRATQLLEMASAVIRGYTRQLIDPVDDETVTLRPVRSTRVLLLPELPVRDVTAVEVAGSALDADAYLWDADGVVMRSGSGASWGAGRDVTITYSHGYTTVPDDLKAICLAVAGRAWEMPGAGAITQESIGNYSVSYADPSRRGSDGMQLDGLERAALDRYRHRGMT